MAQASSNNNRPSNNAPVIELYTDGACLGNPGPGGWACILRDRQTGEEREYSGGEPSTTNNRMELAAVIQGLRNLPPSATVILCSDSKYVLNGINSWMAGWKKRNWRKADRKPVLNADLWQTIDQLIAQHNVEVEWTKGHAGHAENERCDELASMEALREKELAQTPDF
ncbi:MAG: ribonuclease HI [Phycisphaeraceae bacterium]